MKKLLIILLCLCGCSTLNVWEPDGWSIVGENGEARYKNKRGDILIKSYHSHTGMTKDFRIITNDGRLIYPVRRRF